MYEPLVTWAAWNYQCPPPSPKEQINCLFYHLWGTLHTHCLIWFPSYHFECHRATFYILFGNCNWGEMETFSRRTWPIWSLFSVCNRFYIGAFLRVFSGCITLKKLIMLMTHWTKLKASIVNLDSWFNLS